MEFYCLDSDYIFKKKVHFSNYVKVILIPTRKEYSFLSKLLWWDNDDYKLFKFSAVSDLNNIIKRHQGHMTYKEASKILYQSNIMYDKNNFY